MAVSRGPLQPWLPCRDNSAFSHAYVVACSVFSVSIEQPSANWGFAHSAC
jgi:hypothetical protein